MQTCGWRWMQQERKHMGHGGVVMGGVVMEEVLVRLG